MYVWMCVYIYRIYVCIKLLCTLGKVKRISSGSLTSLPLIKTIVSFTDDWTCRKRGQKKD